MDKYIAYGVVVLYIDVMLQSAKMSCIQRLDQEDSSLDCLTKTEALSFFKSCLLFGPCEKKRGLDHRPSFISSFS